MPYDNDKKDIKVSLGGTCIHMNFENLCNKISQVAAVRQSLYKRQETNTVE